ncbi:MAG: cell envelope integrity protein TolA [Isosphaeraceae bacterium]
MSRDRQSPGIAWELIPVLLILGCLVGTAVLVGLAYRKPAGSKRPDQTNPTARVAAAPPPAPATTPRPPDPEPPTPPEPPQPPEDPTERIVNGLKLAEYKERRAAREADRETQALEAARRSAETEIQRRRRRDALVRAQVAAIADQADALEAQADALALERDVLALERDSAKAALEKARARSGGYAVLPHKGANGTWQRPVVIECRDGVAILQPRGLSFTMLDMSPLLGTRSSPLVGAVARETMRIEDLSSPDGSPVAPYIYFIVRPDGIRPFYEARGRLEPLGIAFGYELVDQDWEIEFPDLDTWEAGGSSTSGKPSDSTARAYQWPAERPGSDSRDGSSNPYLWPRSSPGGSVDGAGGQGEGVGPPGEDRRGSQSPSLGRWSDREGVDRHGGTLGVGASPAQGVDLKPSRDGLERRGTGETTVAGSESNPGLAGLPSGRLPDLDRIEGVGPSAGRSYDGPPGSEPSGRVRIVPEMLREDLDDTRPPVRPSGEATGGTPGGSGSGPGARVVEVPLDLVVACGPNGVTIHPGGYRISRATLAREKRLARDLATIVLNYERIDPSIVPRPRLEFLIEPGGSETYGEARRQTVLSGMSWPVTIRVAESSAPDLFGKERF